MTILVIRLGALGDVLRTIPPVRLVRRALPQARIHWAVEDRWNAVLEGHPDLDGLVILPRRRLDELRRGLAGWIRLPQFLAAWRRDLRAVDADLILDFHGNLRSGVTGRLSGAPVRVGYEGHQQKEGNRWFTTHRCPSGDRRTPRMTRNLDLVRALGLPDSPLPDGGLPLVARGHDRAVEVLRATGITSRYAVLSPAVSAAQRYKQPPQQAMAIAARTLAACGVAPLVVWGPGEEPDARALVAESGQPARLAPATDLAALAALLGNAALFVGGDTGPLHLACAVDCPVLGLYGPTDPRVNQPWGVPHRAVFPEGREYTGIKRVDRQHGFEGFHPGQVAEAVEELCREPPAAQTPDA